jgi:hypothetical protein
MSVELVPIEEMVANYQGRYLFERGRKHWGIATDPPIASITKSSW